MHRGETMAYFGLQSVYCNPTAAMIVQDMIDLSVVQLASINRYRPDVPVIGRARSSLS